MITISGLTEPVRLVVSDLDGGAADEVIELLPVDSNAVEIRVENLTRKALQGDYHSPKQWEGRELRWYYYLSQGLRGEEECGALKLPSFERLNEDRGPPICQLALFLPPVSE